MAALRPCPVCITAPASSNLDRSRPRYGSILPLYRSNIMQIRAPLDQSRILLKISRGIRAHGDAAGQPVSPDQDERIRSVFFQTPEKQQMWERVKAIVKGPPDMPFREEADIIDEYIHKTRDEIIRNKSILHASGAKSSFLLCLRVRHAVRLASSVVVCATVRLGSPDEISLHTTTQIMRTYVSVFVRMAEDSHHEKVTRDSIVSLLGAFEGMASISHILVQDTLAYRILIGCKDNSPDPEIDDFDVDRAHLEYQLEMKRLKDKLIMARPSELYKLLDSIVSHALSCTQLCVTQMTGTRDMALQNMRGGAVRVLADDDECF